MLGLAGLSQRLTLQRATAFLWSVIAVLLVAVLLPGSAFAQTFPALTGRVVDAANIIPPDVEARIDQKLTPPGPVTITSYRPACARATAVKARVELVALEMGEAFSRHW